MSTPTQPERPETVTLDYADGQWTAYYPDYATITPWMLGVGTPIVTTHMRVHAANGDAEYIVVGANQDGSLVARRIKREP